MRCSTYLVHCYTNPKYVQEVLAWFHVRHF